MPPSTSPRARAPVWAQLSASTSNSESGETDYAFGAIGAHSRINQNLIVGGMLQLDYSKETDGDASIHGTGWLAGPYFVAKDAKHPVIFEGSLPYGQTRNTLRPFVTYPNDFDTARRLATAKGSGEVVRDNTTWLPNTRLNYVRDDQDGYIDSLGNLIEAQRIDLFDVRVGLDFVTTLTPALDLSGGVSGIYSSSGGRGGQAARLVPATEG